MSTTRCQSVVVGPFDPAVQRAPCPIRHTTGFTLLELLVVLIIIGIIVSFAVVSVSRRGPLDQLEEEAKRLQTLLHVAKDEAVLQAWQIGVRFHEDGYAFLILTEEGWRPPADDQILRTRTLPEDIRAQLSVESEEVSLDVPGEEEESEDGEDPGPQVLLLSSGEATPFELVLRHEAVDGSVTLIGNLKGELELEGPSER